MDVDDIVEELSRLKIYDSNKYYAKLRLLKLKAPIEYQEVIRILGVSDSEIKPVKIGAGDPYNIFKKSGKKLQHTSNIGLVIVGVALAGFVLIGVIFLFLINAPTTSPIILGSNDTVKLGYTIFESINEVFLQYSFVTNITSNDRINSYSGRQYVKLGGGDYDSVSIYFPFFCEPECVHMGEIIEVSYKTDSVLSSQCFEDSAANLSVKMLTNGDLLRLYDELYYYVNNNLVVNSDREGIVSFNDEDCAIIFFDVTPHFSDEYIINSLRYEVCINNDGLPLALGKRLSYTHIPGSGTLSEYIIVGYLESTNSAMIKSSVIGGKTFNEWAVNGIRNYCSSLIE